MFLVAHNILPTNERLNKIGMSDHPWCESETIYLPLSGPLREWEVKQGRRDMVLAVGGEIQNPTHLLCDCLKVREYWCWLRTRVLRLLPTNAQCLSNFEILMLMFPPSKHEASLVWLISNYVHLVWTELCRKEKSFTLAFVVGCLKQKYLLHCQGRNVQLSHINFDC